MLLHALCSLNSENRHGWSLHNVSGQPVPLLGCPHGEKVFPSTQVKPFLLQLICIFLLLPPCTTEEPDYLFGNILAGSGRQLLNPL